MEFPVDTLATVDPESLENSAKDYMSKLLYRNPDICEYLSIPGSNNIEIGLCNVSFVPLYGVNIKQKILALFSPEEPFKAVGLHLLDRWWSAEDILKTEDSSRTGLIKVRTPGERIVLYVLNRIIYRTKEIAGDDVPFLCHGEDEIAKILWKNGEAIGFYSVKPEGRLCNSFLTQRYQLPVMDTVFIRKRHRGNGHGLQILEDFVDSFKKDIMGLKYPLSPAMYKVCKKYLSLYPEDKELLWEIEGVGSPFQRTQIARKLQAMELKGNLKVMGKLSFDTEDSDIPMDVAVAPVRETMEYTEVVEEVVQIKIMKEVQDTPVTIRCRSSNLKHEKLGANTEETPEKIIRVEDIESDVQCPEHDDITLSMDTMETMTCDVTPISEITRLHCEEQNEMTAEPTYQSKTEKEQVVEMTPVMQIESLKGDQNAQILKTFKATIAPAEFQALELQQVVEVEVVKMSSETDEVNEKAVDVKEMKGDVVKEIPLDGREPSEEVVDSQKDQTDMATANKEDLGEEGEMTKISVVENIVDDAEETDVEKQQAGALEVSLEEKEQSEQAKEGFSVQECLCEKHQESEDQEPSRENEEEKVYTLIRQEENFNMPYSSGSKLKHGDKPKPRHSRRLKDQAAECDLTERVLRSSSKKTLKATSNQAYTKQVDDEPKEKGFNQTECPAELHEGEQVEEIAENENVEGKIKSVSIMCDKMEDSSQEENRLDEKLWKAEQEQVTAAGVVVAKTTMDGKEIGFVDVNNTQASEITLIGKAAEPSAAEDIEEQEEEPAAEPVSAEDDNNNNNNNNTQVFALKRQKAAVTFGGPTEKQQVVEMADNENVVVVVEDRIKNSNIEETEVRHGKMMIKENIIAKNENTIHPINKNKMEEAQEEEPMKVGKTTKDDEKIAVFDVYDTEDVYSAEMVVEGKVPQPSAPEPVEKQEEEPTSEMVPAEIAQNTEEATSNLNLPKVAAVLVDLNKVSTTCRDASEDAKRTSQPTDDRENNLVTPDEAVTSKDLIESNEDGEAVKSDDQIEMSEEEKGKTNFVTPSQRSRRLKHRAEERELTKIFLRRSAKAAKSTSKPKDIKQRSKTKQALGDPEVEQMKEVVESNIRTAVEEKIGSVLNESALDDVEEERNMDEEHLDEKTNGCQNLMEVEKKTEDSTQDENKVETKLRNEEQEKGTTAEETKSTKDGVEKLAVVVHDAEDVRADEIEFERKSLEPPAAEPVVEEEPALEIAPAEDDNNTEEATATLKLQNVAVESDDREMDKGTSQPREEVVQDLHKPESTDQRNEGKEGVNQTECEVEPSEIEQDVEMTENKREETEVRDERMEIEENIVSKVEDKFPESTYTDDKKMDEAQEKEPMQQTNTNQDIPGKEPIIHDDIESSEDDEGLKSDAKDKTSFVTSSRWSRRLEHQVAESELTKRVLRSATKAIKQQVKIKQALDDPEVEQMKKVLESHTETAVEEKSESASITTETEHLKAVGIEFEEKTSGQTDAEPVEEQEEEPASETRPAEDDNTKEATSCLNAGKDANGTLKSHEEVDLELYNPESSDTESQAEHVEKEQVMEMTENEIEETDKKVESAILNDEDGVLVSAVTNKEIQKDIDTAQEIQVEEPKTVCVIESSEDEGERSDVSIKLDEEEEAEASSLTPLRRSRRLKDQVTESELIKSVLRRSARLTNKATPQQKLKQQIKAMVLEEPKQLEESNDEMNINLGSEVTVGEHMESETLHVFAEGDPEMIILAVKSTCEEGSNLEKGDIEADDHKNIKNISISQGEENISSEDVTEQEKRAPEDIMHGEAEHICTSGEKSAVDIELSEATEKMHGEDENVTETTSALTLQEASVVLVDVKKVLPLDPLDLHNTEIVKGNISVAEQEEELATELAPEEDRNNVGESTFALKLHKAAVVLVDFQRQSGGNGNETTQLQEGALQTKEYEEKALVEMNVKEPMTERKEEEAVELCTDNTLVTNDEQDRDILAEEGVREYLKEVEDSILREESTSTQLDANKTLKEYEESKTPCQESTQDEDISVCVTKNLRRRTLPGKAMPERKSRHPQNIYNETKVNENTEGESSDEEGETVFIRHLRRRTVTVTPRKKCKPLTGTRVAALEMEAHVSEVCHEIVAVERTEEDRNAVEEMHETSSKCDSEEVPAVSEVAWKDQQQDKSLPGNDAEKVEEVTEGRKQIEAEVEAVETTDREILVEGFLLDENQEKKEPDEPNQEKVRSPNSEEESHQQHHVLEEAVLEETFEEHLEEEKDDAMNMLISEAVVDESEEGEGVERRALRKRTTTVKAASVRKSKRLCKQDQGENEGQAVVWANTEVSAAAEATVMEMAHVKSPTEKEVADSQEIEDTSIIGGDISHKEVDQGNSEGNANNSQERTMTEDMTEHAQLSEFLNVSDEGTDIKPAAQEEEEGEENREEHSATEEVMKSEHNAGKAAEIGDEPGQFEDNREESEQSEKNAEGMTEASVSVDENFTLELDEEINGSDAECNQVVRETKASFQESEKQISGAERESGELTNCILRGRKSATASAEQRSAGRSRRLLQGSPSETNDQPEAEEVKEVIGEEDKKCQQKRKAIVELTPRRSKRLARAEIV